MLVIFILKRNPVWVEEFYSHGIYIYISSFLRKILGYFPFSIGDVFYAFLIVLFIAWLRKRITTRFKNPRKWMVATFASISVLFLFFHLNWGLNYYRLPLHQSLKIEANYNTESLLKYTQYLVEKSNELHRRLAENDSITVNFPFDKKDVFQLSVEGYHHIQQQYPELTYQNISVKPSLFRYFLTIMGFNGYLNPITNEAQINTKIPLFKLPTTTSHEIGHQLGFAKENEANYMACLVTMSHPNDYMKYAGYTFALSYCLGEVSKRDVCLSEDLYASINLGIIKEYQQIHQFWSEHENPLEPFFKLFYGQYLKANNQPQGLQSYNYVVALLVNKNLKG